MLGPWRLPRAVFPNRLFSMSHLQISWRGRGRDDIGREAVRGNWNPLPERNQKSNLWLSCAVRGLDFLICETALTASASLGCGSEGSRSWDLGCSLCSL